MYYLNNRLKYVMEIVLDGQLISYRLVNPDAPKPLIILHGWGHSASLWQPLAKLIKPQYRIYLIDLPGFGNSPLLPGNPGVPQYSQIVFAFIKKLKLIKPTVIGHSFGGQIVTFQTTTQPQLFSLIFLVSPAIIRDKSFTEIVKIFLYSRFKILKNFVPKPLLIHLYRLVSSSDYASASPSHQQILTNIVNFHQKNRLSSIKIPTHIIWGDQDREIAYTGKLLENSIPNSRLHVLYRVGHNPHLTHPNELATLINRYLQ